MSSPARTLFDPPAQAPARSPAPPRQPSAPSDDHFCAVCGVSAGFGFGVFLRRGFEGRWSCMAHRDDVEAMPG